MLINRFDEKNAAEKIDGYYRPTPMEDMQGTLAAVERARAECVGALRRQIECIEALPAAKFYFLSGRKSVAMTENGLCKRK